MASTSWGQGSYERIDSKGKARFCLCGGVRHIIDPERDVDGDIDEWEHIPEYEAALRLLAEQIGVEDPVNLDALEDAIVEWNDEQGRTRDQVLAVLNRAIREPTF